MYARGLAIEIFNSKNYHGQTPDFNQSLLYFLIIA